MKKKIFYSIIVFLISFKLHSLEVTLTQGTIKPTPIAVTNFYSEDDTSVKAPDTADTAVFKLV